MISTGEGTLYMLDLMEFGTTEGPGLGIANETLAFPLALGPTQQSLSLTNPGDLVVAYTRVGCWIDPEEWIGTDGTVPIELPEAEPVTLTHVTIDQFAGVGVTATPEGLAEGTCLTLKSQGGTWTPFLQPQTITLLSEDSVRVEFVIDGVSADSAALFLPTYTSVLAISYRVAHAIVSARLRLSRRATHNRLRNLYRVERRAFQQLISCNERENGPARRVARILADATDEDVVLA